MKFNVDLEKEVSELLDDVDCDECAVDPQGYVYYHKEFKKTLRKECEVCNGTGWVRSRIAHELIDFVVDNWDEIQKRLQEREDCTPG